MSAANVIKVIYNKRVSFFFHSKKEEERNNAIIPNVTATTDPREEIQTIAKASAANIR